jgi:predicted ATPase/DNA-binding winged helix-turn-helix (wHTH) protein
MPRSQHDEEGAVSFGPFRLFPAERLLEKDGVALHLGGRALDILILLVERAGEVVSKRELVARVWADVTVDEGSLRFHVAALRKALGDGQSGARYVTNVPGRGYCLVAPVSRSNQPDAASVVKAASVQPRTLPAKLARMVGREDTVRQIADDVAARRFVTIVGPGGIGKTTVAIAVGHRLQASFDGAVHFLDLGALSDPRLVPVVLASMLGLVVHSDDPVPGLLASLRDKRMLLVLDSCERVIDALAPLAERIVAAAPPIHILATSREALRVEGEQVHLLSALDCPPVAARLKAAAALGFPAVQLFVERAAAAGSSGFALSDADAPAVAEICVRLDGIALAIEIAAGRVGAYGIRGIAALLDGRFGLLWQGRRTALPRHQTLSSALDWSYDLLSEVDRVILQRLAVFVGVFTLEAAQAVVAGDGIDEAQLVEAIADLVAKSLVSSEIGATPVRYRLLDTTRAYLLGKLIASDTADAIQRRHAAYYRQSLERILADAPGSLASGIAPPREFIGNVQAALEWSFSPEGDLALGIGLAAAAARFFAQASLLTECHRWSERAIAALDAATRGSRSEMELQASLGLSLMFTRGNREEVRSAFARGLELAETLDDPQHQLEMLSGLHIYLTRTGDFRGALALGERSEAIARRLSDPASLTVANWMVGVAQHLIGDQAAARAGCETAVRRMPIPPWARGGYDRRIIALVALTRALWLGGYPDRAMTIARYTVTEAEAQGHPLTLCISMIWTVYVFLWAGEWATAAEIIERIIAHAAKHSLGPYHAVGLGLRGELAIKRGNPEAGLGIVRDCLDALYGNRHQILTAAFAGDLAEGLAMTGQVDEALATIDGAIADVRSTGESCDMPELLRIKGQVLRYSSPNDSAKAEDCLRQSLDWAREQSALGWELRTATSLAQLWCGAGRAGEALGLLAPVYARFSEGFDTADLKAARKLLEELGRSTAP